MTGNRDDVRRRLERLGVDPAPAVDEAFVARTETQLRAAVPAHSRQRERVRFGPGLAAAAAALAVVVVGALVVGRDDRASVSVASATGADVLLPDGRVVPALRGGTVPEGAVVRTGPDGSAVVGGVPLGPGQAAVVEEGRARPVEPGTEPSPPRTAPPSTERGATRPPRASSTTSPPPARPTTSSPDTRPASMRLAARRVEGGVQLQWSIYEGQDFARYVLLRRPGGGEPVYPPRDGTEVIGDIADRGLTRWGDRAPPAAPAYRLVALNADGSVVGASPVARP